MAGRNRGRVGVTAADLSPERVAVLRAKFAEVQRLIEQRRPDDALRVLAPMERECRGIERYAAMRASVEHDLKMSEDAYARLWPVVRSPDASVPSLALFAKICQSTGRNEEALDALGRAWLAQPANPEVANLYAGQLNTAGDPEGALRVCREAGLADGSPEGLVLRTHAARAHLDLGRPEEATETLAPAIAPDAPAVSRRIGAFVESAILAKGGDHVGAFDAASRAHATEPAPWDPDAFDRAVDEMIEGFSPEFLASAHRAPQRNERAALIVGMPRSGTSLVEQILDCHPRARGGGELNELTYAVARSGPAAKIEGMALLGAPAALEPRVIDGLGDAYAKRLRAIDRRARVVSDKMPLNILHLGLLELIAPGARVIRCRRDPRDVGASIWMLPFQGSHAYAERLDHLGRFMRTVDRLAAHWASVLSVPILDMEYQAMVSEPKEQTARMLEFLGLEWDDACLRFHESRRKTWTASSDQVRRPVTTGSLGRWKRYDDRLDPLIAELGGLELV